MILPLLAIVGPTASGKSQLGVELALRMGGEIISGDSMQVYRKMNIGTAKLKPEEMKGVPHHLIDIRNPDEPFSVADFQQLATQRIAEIAGRHKLPMLVGGTGLYIQAVLDPYEFQGQKDAGPIREELLSLAKTKGNQYLFEQLQKIDPESARKIHVNDLKRLIRALEYYRLNGKRISEKRAVKDNPYTSGYHLTLLGLSPERTHLYERINRRVDSMMEEGLVDEVKTLLEEGYSPKMPALQGLGYKQIIGSLQGEYNLQEATDLIKRDTRRFAKRQLTWFRRDPRIHWLDPEKYRDTSQLLLEIMSIIGRTINRNVE